MSPTLKAGSLAGALRLSGGLERSQLGRRRGRWGRRRQRGLRVRRGRGRGTLELVRAVASSRQRPLQEETNKGWDQDSQEQNQRKALMLAQMSCWENWAQPGALAGLLFSEGHPQQAKPARRRRCFHRGGGGSLNMARPVLLHSSLLLEGAIHTFSICARDSSLTLVPCYIYGYGFLPCSLHPKFGRSTP